MAVRGRKPKPDHLKLVTGNPGRRPLNGAGVSGETAGGGELAVREDPLEPPKRLTKAQQALWDRFINTAWWLTDHDVPKAYVWVCLQAEYLKSPAKMIASRIAQLRVIGTELGLDPSARSRMGAGGKKKDDPTEEFFD